MLEWFKALFVKPSTPKIELAWKELLSGDHVRLSLKDPYSVGIISSPESMTFQRLDEEDVRTKSIEGFVIRTTKVQPGNIDVLEINVVKRRGTNTRLVVYLLLKEEINSIETLGE